MRAINIISLLFFSILFKSLTAQHVVYYRDYNSQMGGHYVDAPIWDTTAQGNYLAVGGTYGPSGSYYLYAEIDKNGNILWQKDSAIYDSMFWEPHAHFYKGRRTLDNGFIFCGYLRDYNVSFESCVFIMKSDSAGNEIWRKSFQPGSAIDIFLGEDSSLYFTGNNQYGAAAFLLKLNSNGDSVFMKQYQCNYSPSDLLFIDQKFYICGDYYFSGINNNLLTTISWMVTDSLGDSLKFHTIVDSLYSKIPFNYSKTSDNGILITSSVVDTNLVGTRQILKTDTAGNVLWIDTLSQNNYYNGYACELPNRNILAGFGNNNIWLLDSTGTIIWNKDFSDTTLTGFAEFDIFSLLPLDTMTFLISSTVSVSSPNGRWPYLTKVSSEGVISVFEIDGFKCSVFPNPVKDILTIKIEQSLTNSNYTIEDLYGRTITRGKLKNEITKIDLSYLKPALYILRIGERQIVKVMKS